MNLVVLIGHHVPTIWRAWYSKYRITCATSAFVLSAFLALNGCLAPIALHRAVLEYDQTTAQIQSEMLLLNIGRAQQEEPLHFTSVSSVAATFNFETMIGIAPAQSNTSTLVAPIFSTTVAENPTITIVPVEGEEFTKRILSPISSEKLLFLARQGVTPGFLFRLLAERLVIIEEGRTRVIRNRPDYRDEYAEFRRRVLHSAYLQHSNKIHVFNLDFEEALAFSIPLNSSGKNALQDLEQIFRAEERGYTWKPDPDKRAGVLSRKVSGPLVMTNYLLAELSNEERRQFREEISSFPENALPVDIRPGHPGGDYPLHGYYQFRSFLETLQFVAFINSRTPEFEVKPDPRSGPVEPNPTLVLKIEETVEEPMNTAFKVKHGGLWYWIRKPETATAPVVSWNLEAFRALVSLYEMTKADVSKKTTPAITIAK